MLVDLHTHSKISDGSEPPARLIELAAGIGLGAVALTDHDTQDGIAEAGLRADQLGIELVPGAEISCGGHLHLIALFLEPGPGPLQDRLAWIREGRDIRNQAIVDRLVAAGIPITMAEVREEAGDGVVGRPHFAARLVARGYAESIPDAFARWLGSDQPAYAPRRTLDAVEAVRLTRASGAVPIVAHPHTIDPDLGSVLEGRLEPLIAAGLVGVELYYSGYDGPRFRRLRRMIERRGLLPSGGSDFHGTYKPGVRLGTGDGTLAIPGSVLDDLRAAAGPGVEP